MRILRLFLAAAVPLALAACGGDAEDADETAATEPLDNGAAVTTTPVPTPEGTVEQSQADAMQHNVQLSSLGGSSVTGNASLVPAENGTQVVLTVNGGGGAHQAHIHQGTCENLGSVVAPLEPVTTDQAGTGTSTTMLDAAATAQLTGEHVVSVHEAGGTPGTPVACAPLNTSTMSR